VLPLSAVDDLWKEAAPGAQGDAALGRVVDLAVPAVAGADGREVVPRGAQPIGHEPAGGRRGRGPPRADLRHTAGTLATVAGGSLREVMDHLGHSTTVAAVRYQHGHE